MSLEDAANCGFATESAQDSKQGRDLGKRKGEKWDGGKGSCQRGDGCAGGGVAVAGAAAAVVVAVVGSKMMENQTDQNEIPYSRQYSNSL